MIIMINPMLNLYILIYRFNNVVSDYINGCKNQMTLAELEELAEEEEKGDA